MKKKYIVISLIISIFIVCGYYISNANGNRTTSSSSSTRVDYGNVEELIKTITQNPLRIDEYTEFTVRGIVDKMGLSGSNFFISLKRPIVSSNSFLICFKLNNFPSELYNIAPGDIINVKGYYESGMMSYNLTNCSIINIEKKYNLVEREIYTGRQFFNLLHSNFLWANGKTFNVRAKVKSIREIQGNIVLCIEGMNMADYLMIYDFPFVFDNRLRSQILGINVGDIVTIRGVFRIGSFFGLNEMGMEQCELVN